MAHFKAYYSAIFWAKFEISTIFFVYCKFNGFNMWFCLKRAKYEEFNQARMANRIQAQVLQALNLNHGAKKYKRLSIQAVQSLY